MDYVLEGLDPQQAAAASHFLGKAVVIAGAGSGKTRILVRRAAYLIAKGVDPASILLTSFTRASAAEIMGRAAEFDHRASRITCGTFHSVGANIVRGYHEVFGFPRNFTILDQGDSEDAVKSAIARATSGLDIRASRVAKIISYSRNTGLPYEEVMALPQNEEHASQLQSIIEVAKAYKDLKRRMCVLDYDDVLAYWAYLAEHETHGAELRRNFRHIMVDEHQDSNHLQMRILHGLGDRSPGSVMVVGDPSQSIYAFRGAAPATMFRFAERWPDASTYIVERNYRSSSEIVAAAEAVDRTMGRRFERNLVAARGALDTKPTLVLGSDQDDCTAFLVDLIKDRWKEDGVPLSDQAVLVRSTKRARKIEMALEASGVPYRFVGGIRLHDAQHVKDIICGLRIVANPADRLSWLRMLGMFPKVGDKSANRIADRLLHPDEGGVDARSGADEIRRALASAAHTEKRGAQLEALPDILDAIASERNNAQEALRRALAALEPLLSARFDDEWGWRSRELLEIIDLAGGYGRIDDFLQTMTLDVSVDKGGPQEESEYGSDVLTVSTIHGAKGLEWHTVYVPEFVDGHIPSLTAKTDDDREDERRLFYVAVTRARDDLYFFRPLEAKTLKRGNVPTVPSPFETIIVKNIQKHPRHPDRPAPPPYQPYPAMGGPRPSAGEDRSEGRRSPAPFAFR